MTHVATAVISATHVPKKRQQSFAIRNAIQLFENKENVQTNGTREPLGKVNRGLASRVGGNNEIIINGAETAPNERQIKQHSISHIGLVIDNGGETESAANTYRYGENTLTKQKAIDHPSSSNIVIVNGVRPQSKDRQVDNERSSVAHIVEKHTVQKTASNVVIVNGGQHQQYGKTNEQRYRNVVVKAPSINISVAPWTPGGKVVTDSDNDEVQRILAQRRKLIDSSIEAAEAAKQSNLLELRPQSLDLSDDSNRESSGASLNVSFPRALDLARHNIRMLWRDVQGVADRNLVESLDKDARTRQEAKFELMLSEGSYLHGLNSLNTHYMRNIKKHIPQVVSEKDYELLFKYVEDVRLCSEAFLTELDQVWQNDPMLDGIYDVVAQHTSNHFQAYVRYCRNMVDMSSHLRTLTANNKSFAELLTLLTSREGGQRLTLDAFLTAPMQRITKLPLLLRTIIDKAEAGGVEHGQCTKAYEAASKIAQECDEVVNERKRLEEVLRLSHEIEFAEDTRAIPIVSPTRALVSLAYVKHFAFRDGAPRREKLHLILFNDLLLVTKKKSDIYLVVDWCNRDELCMKEVENGALYGKEDAKQTNPVVFTMRNNSQDKKLDLVVTFKDQNLRKEWLGMLSEEETEDSSEEEQMIVLHEHTPADQSQLAISPGDVIKVLAQPDEAGWCLGELLSDGSRGLFPIEKTTKITSPRVKAANLKAKKEMRASKNIEDIVQTTPEEET